MHSIWWRCVCTLHPLHVRANVTKCSYIYRVNRESRCRRFLFPPAGIKILPLVVSAFSAAAERLGDQTRRQHHTMRISAFVCGYIYLPLTSSAPLDPHTAHTRARAHARTHAHRRKGDAAAGSSFLPDSGAAPVCQKCLKPGQWTYECKASGQCKPVPYKARPSRTAMMKNPKLRTVSVPVCPCACVRRRHYYGSAFLKQRAHDASDSFNSVPSLIAALYMLCAL